MLHQFGRASGVEFLGRPFMACCMHLWWVQRLFCGCSSLGCVVLAFLGCGVVFGVLVMVKEVIWLCLRRRLFVCVLCVCWCFVSVCCDCVIRVFMSSFIILCVSIVLCWICIVMLCHTCLRACMIVHFLSSVLISCAMCLLFIASFA